MCGGPEHLKPASPHTKGKESNTNMADSHSNKVKEISESCSNLHELAANNDLIGFKKAMEEDGSKVDEVNFWYCRQNGSNQMVLEQRTPLMVASLYGSIDVLNYILSIYVTCGADVNQACGSDKSTALHCAAAGGSIYAVEAVKLLIQSGGDINCVDAYGRRPAGVVMVSPRLSQVKANLEEMLNSAGMYSSSPMLVPNRLVGPHGGDSNGTEPLSQSNLMSISAHTGTSSPSSGSPQSATSSPKFMEATKMFADGNEKKEYPVDPSLPDIKNSIYTTDEFRMFSFKVRPCSRAYSHDWTECPFVHPGENARRRDPRRYHYSCVPCPDFRKGACRRGDMCEYAHGVFECWLHPAQYRTRLCKDGTSCARRVCFFAHTSEELRPLFVSTGSAVPSPRASSALDMSSVMSPLAPGSPSSVSISPFSLTNTQQGNVLTPPMSPSASSVNGLGHSSLCAGWPQPNVPTLNLPVSNFQASRLRAELNARDMPVEDSSRIADFEGQLLSEFSPLSTQARMNAAAAVMSGNGNTTTRNGKYKSHGISVAPTNLDDLFASEITSPRLAVLEPSIFSQMSPQMQAHKTAHVYSQLQNQMLPPINTQAFSQGTTQMQQAVIEPHSPGHSLMQSPFQSSSYALPSPGRMSPRCLDVERHGTNGSSLTPALAASFNSRAAAFIQREKRSLSSRELGAHLPPGGLSDWGSPTGKVDWGFQGEDLNKFRKSASFGPRSYEEPDLSWVQTLVKENTPEGKDRPAENGSGEIPIKGPLENVDHSVLGAWLEQMQLDQIVA
ncbi:zinc finger CCCH domain-containing protein 30 [Cryptomeria japonica]|uniref:zinc finger CCCH domain-containing protein 30 n=1 Tax=Cryptomeria japonica TaxID=3369 RepID=UPI0027DA7272|nr:zinc finger CCCH domain-containing protein 30 [Cryptomeria japonica]